MEREPRRGTMTWRRGFAGEVKPGWIPGFVKYWKAVSKDFGLGCFLYPTERLSGFLTFSHHVGVEGIDEGIFENTQNVHSRGLG